MSKHISLSGLKTLLEPLVHLINKKAERPDWNENDPSSADYIENRPFYEENGFVEYAVYVTNDFVSYDVPLPSFVEGETYEIAWDGVKYSCVAYTTEYGFAMIGNDIIAEAGSTGGNGEPFAMLVFEGDNLIFSETTGNHTIGLVGTVVHKIDEKYLPEMSSVGKKGTGEGAEVFNDYENNVASGDYAHAEGTYISSRSGMILSTASGAASHSEGMGCVASGGSSHAEGFNTIASGDSSHAEGGGSEATGDDSHAEGSVTIASGSGSHAEGYKSQAIGSGAHAEGENTVANGDYQHVQGKYNVPDSENIYAHIVGNGPNTGNEQNIHTLDWDGNAWFKGDVLVGGSFGTYGCIGSKKLATEEYVSTKVPVRNLLDNSNFEVAQAGYGGMHGNTPYAADRWPMSNGLNVSHDGIGLTITPTSSATWYANIRQVINVKNLKDKTLTFAAHCKSSNKMRFYAWGLTTDAGINTTYWTGDNTDDGVYVVSFTIDSSFPEDYAAFTFAPDCDSSKAPISRLRMGLYEGEYTAETLPPYVEPDPILELAKCQYYAQNLVFDIWTTLGESYTSMAGYLSFRIPIATMRDGIPDVVFPTSGWYIDGEASMPFNGSITKTRRTGNFVEIQVYDQNITTGFHSLSTRDMKVNMFLDLNL